jgi:hypothetical protein
MGLGVGDAFVQQPGVQLVEDFEPQPRREEALPEQPDLVSTWPFSQPDAGVQATGSTIVATHLQEAALPMKIVSTAVFMLS